MRHWMLAIGLVAILGGRAAAEELELGSSNSPLPALLQTSADGPSSAASGGCGVECGDVCCRRPRFYGGVEYIMQWFENQRVPPLVVIVPPPAQQIGPASRILYGGQPIDFGGLDGIRATAGYWLDSQQRWAVELSGFLTEPISQNLAVVYDGADTNPVVLARTDGTLAIAALIGVPGVQRGAVTVSQDTRLWGAESNIVLNSNDCRQWRLELLGGFRYLDLDESLDIAGFSGPLVGQPNYYQADSFDARTQFWGPQFGSKLTAAWGVFSLSVISKLGVGVSHLAVQRTGESLSPLGRIEQGGLLVTPLNFGRDTTDRAAALSETTIQVGWQWSKCVATTVGYNFLYLTSSARVGDQISPIGGINATDFYTNGITFGLSCRY